MRRKFLLSFIQKMKNKNLLFSLGTLTLAIGCFWLSFTSATTFKLNIDKFETAWVQLTSMVPIHFADNWNDFWGFIYLSDWIIITTAPDEEGVEPEEPENPETTWDIYCIYSNPSVTESANCAGAEYVCEKQVKWFYYNAERWERLWPLDEETGDIWGQEGLVTEGWLYTMCRKNTNEEGEDYITALKQCETLETLECSDDDPDCDPNLDSATCVSNVNSKYPLNKWYFGQLSHEYKEQMFGLVIWAGYKKNANTYGWYEILKDDNDVVQLGETFVRHEGKFPLGFVYDYNGWLWFAWCQITGNDKNEVLTKLLQRRPKRGEIFSDNKKGWLKVSEDAVDGYIFKNKVNCVKIWSVADDLLKLIIEWLVGMNSENGNDLGYIWTQDDQKMQYFSSSDINNATLLNYVKQRSEILCRWKWDKVDSNDSIVCLTTASGSDDVNADDYIGKTLIVKGRNVIVNPVDSPNDPYYDIFINGWELLINEDASTKKFVFTTQWFIDEDETITLESYKQKFVDIWWIGNYQWKLLNEDWVEVQKDWAGVGSLIKWNFIVNWNVMGVNGKLKNKYFIYWKFTTKDSISELEKTFTWRCKNWLVINNAWQAQNSQRRYCPVSYKDPNASGDEVVYTWYNPYAYASLVVIDQNYSSPLYW